jgi:hypothetical protein
MMTGKNFARYLRALYGSGLHLKVQRIGMGRAEVGFG